MTDTLVTSAHIDVEQRDMVAGAVTVAYSDQSDAATDPPALLILPREWADLLGVPGALRITVEVRCRECGCTDSQACFLGCSWVEPGLCSSCKAPS